MNPQVADAEETQGNGNEDALIALAQQERYNSLPENGEDLQSSHHSETTHVRYAEAHVATHTSEDTPLRNGENNESANKRQKLSDCTNISP